MLGSTKISNHKGVAYWYFLGGYALFGIQVLGGLLGGLDSMSRPNFLLRNPALQRHPQ